MNRVIGTAPSILFLKTSLVAVALNVSALVYTTNAAQITYEAVSRPLKSLQISPTEVAGGCQPRPEGTVELFRAPGPEGITIKLESSNPQVAQVPASVTITSGAYSSETGPIIKKSFYITTQPVKERTDVTIRARAGTQTIEAKLRIKLPQLKEVYFDSPSICDGDNKGTLRYTLTGLAPPETNIFVRVTVESPTGHKFTADAHGAVSPGDFIGRLRMVLPSCRAASPANDNCMIKGFANVNGLMKNFGGFCHAPN